MPAGRRRDAPGAMLRTLDRALGALVISGNSLGSAWIFVMMLAIAADIAMRFLFNAPINGTTELVTMSVVAVLYLQLAYTLRSGSMTRSDAVLNRLVARYPRVGHGMSVVFYLAGAALMGAIVRGAWPKWIKSYELDFYVGVVGVFTFPDWPRLLVVFLGCTLTGLQFLVLAAGSARALLQPEAAR